MAGPGDDRERKLWNDVGDALDTAGSLPERPSTAQADKGRAVPEGTAQDEQEFEADERFVDLIDRLCDTEYGDAVVCAYGDADEDNESAEPDFDLVGYILPCNNKPETVVVVFNSGFFCVLFQPKDDTLAAFHADFMPGKGAYHLQIGTNEDMTPEKRFLAMAAELYHTTKLLRSDLEDDEAEAWEVFRKALEGAEELKRQRLGTQGRQSDRAYEGLLRLLGHESPGAVEDDTGEA